MGHLAIKREGETDNTAAHTGITNFIAMKAATCILIQVTAFPRSDCPLLLNPLLVPILQRYSQI